MSNNSQNIEGGKVVLYKKGLEVQLKEETVWLTQAQMVLLFQKTKQNISLHINNIFKEEELHKNSVVKESLTTASDGKNYKTKQQKYLPANSTSTSKMFVKHTNSVLT